MIKANTVYVFNGWVFKIEPAFVPSDNTFKVTSSDNTFKVKYSDTTFKVEYQKSTDSAKDWNMVIVDADDPRDALMKAIENIRTGIKDDTFTLKHIWMNVDKYGEDQECFYEIRDGITMSVSYVFSDYYNPFQCSINFNCDTGEDPAFSYVASGANKRDAFIKAFKGILGKGDLANIYALELLHGATMAITDLETDGQ